MFYFIFINFHYNEIQRRSNAEKESMLLSVQIKQAKKDLNEFWEQQEKTAIYRHDMRHHLNLIAGFLAEGDTSKSMEYINRVQSNIMEVTPIRYCENNTVNLILSYYACKAETCNITLTIDAQIRQDLSIVETELCALLSNGLENAFNACTQVEDERARTVQFKCKVQKEKLVIYIENSFTGIVIEENGLPKSTQPDHGYGIKSMVMIIDKYSGCYSYTAEDGIFKLSIVLPLMKEHI
jgi:sensor histidine kinase regulating citrate/malate metabolism